jgi:DNA topoisomerase-1
MITVRLGKFGAFAQLGEAEEDKKPPYASLKKGQLIETLTLEEALDLFKLPRTAGDFEDKPMTIAIGMFGPYVKHDGKYYSLAKTDDPLTVSAERAAQIIQDKRQAEIDKLIKEFPENADVKVLNGRYGPYVQFGKKNVKIPKGIEPKDITMEQCIEWEATTPEKKGRFGKKAPVAKKAAEPKKAATKKKK